VSQLWIALEKRDGTQWRHFLGALAENRRVTSKDLRAARDQWEKSSKHNKKGGLKRWDPEPFRQEAMLARTQALFERRFEAYGGLLPLTDYGREDQPKNLDRSARRDLASKLTDWFYEGGAGLLLSGRALEQFEKARWALKSAEATPADIREVSQLRNRSQDRPGSASASRAHHSARQRTSAGSHRDADRAIARGATSS
jgi:hypothetical protein